MRRRAALVGRMVRKDLLRTWRAPLAIAVTLAFPLIIALLLALAFGGGGGDEAIKVRLLIEDRDRDLVGRMVRMAYASGPAAGVFEIEEVGREGWERIERGEASALLRLPEDLTERALRGEVVEIELIRNPAEGILPEIAEQVTRVLTEFMSSASLLMRAPLDEISRQSESGSAPTEGEVAAISLAVGRTLSDSGDVLFPPAITLETVREEVESEEAADPESQLGFVFRAALPGLSVFALFLLADRAMRDLLTEKTLGTLRRQASGPLTATTLVAGKVAFTGLLTGISLLLLVLVAWLTDPSQSLHLPAFFLLCVALVLAATGVTSLIYGIAANDRQGATFGSLVFLVMAFLGGSFVPAQNFPDGLQRLAPLSLFYWPNEAFAALIQRGGGWAEVLPAVGVLATAGLVALALGSRSLERKIAQGGV